MGGDASEEWWLDLGTYARVSLVPEEYGADFGFDPKKHEIVRPDDTEWQPGEVPYAGYPAVIEWQHKLHCIDLLRQASFYEHEYYESLHTAPWIAGRETLMRHVGHCVDILRQQVICDAELTPVPFEKNAGKHPRNDWTLPRKCRNFESARTWLADHQFMAAQGDFRLNDHHGFEDRPTFSRVPHHSMEELWRGY